VVELEHRGFACSAQATFPVRYRGIVIDEYVPDLLVNDQLIVETKVVQAIENKHLGQIINYLKICKKSAGVILNFDKPTLEWRKVSLTQPLH
jgi:GxxExxY protein